MKWCIRKRDRRQQQVHPVTPNFQIVFVDESAEFKGLYKVLLVVPAKTYFSFNEILRLKMSNTLFEKEVVAGKDPSTHYMVEGL